MVNENVYAGGQRVASVSVPHEEDGSLGDPATDGTLTYYHQDHLGGTQLTTDEYGVVTQVYDYYPYGSELLDENLGAPDVPYSFTGKELNEDTGLYYFEARWYDPTIGRFMSVDPMQYMDVEKLLGDPQSFSAYAYSKNNPIVYIDPFGLEATIIIRQDNDGLNGSDFGHAAIEIDGNVYHYYAVGGDEVGYSDLITGTEATVTVEDGTQDFYNNYNKEGSVDELFTTYTIETTDEENQAMADYFTGLQADTPEYKLFSNNCSTVIQDAMEAAGVADFSSGVQSQAITPRGFEGRIKQEFIQGDIKITDTDRFYESEVTGTF